MQVIEAGRSQRPGYLPSGELLLLGLCSVAALYLFRISSVQYAVGMWAECLLLLAAPVALLFWVAPRLTEKGVGNGSGAILWLQLGAAASGVLVLVVQLVMLQFGSRDAYEIISLLMMCHVGWYCVVFSKFGSFERVALVVSSALVLFVCFMTNRFDVYAVSLLFAITVLWRLLGAYWDRINNKSLDGESRMLPVNGVAIVSTLLLAGSAGSLVWMFAPSGEIYRGSGFSFFAGGESGFEDEFARSGIGDGNMLTGGANATTAGAVDTDNFIEDDKPSIYDTMSEKFEGPLVKKKRLNRAIALEARAKHMHQVIQSEQAGKSFRTTRMKAKETELSLEERRTNALFFVEGHAPIRFGVDCFQHFDGETWTKTEVEPKQLNVPPIRVVQRWGKPFYSLQRVRKSYLSSRQAHRVKIMRIDTRVLPATPFLSAWHIHRVEVENMFDWNGYGLVQMSGDFIPAHTVIDLVSDVPNYHVLESADTKYSKTADPESLFLQMPDNDTRPCVEAIVSRIVEGIEPGWNQIDAIVNHFRENYVHDVTLVDDGQSDDSVRAFLDNGGGPSYLFATAATQFLRSAGYRTRLASGYVVTADDYDRQAQQSIVTYNNAHFWPEVSLDGSLWIPLEPDPAFAIPSGTQTWWQWASGKFGEGLLLVKRNPVRSAVALLSLVMLTLFRKELLVGIFGLGWRVGVNMLPGSRLKLTRKLIDARFRTAGLARPSFASIRDWFSQVDATAGADFFSLWWKDNFGPANSPRASAREVYLACQQIESQLSFDRIKSFVLNNENRKLL